MSLLTFHSENPDFSWLIGKKPDSGLQIKKNRKGHMLGWFPQESPRSYAVWFKDSQYESSYNFIGDQAHNDPTNFNSAMFVIDAFGTFFRALWLHGVEQDVPDLYEHQLTLNQFYMKNDKYVDIFQSAFGDSFKLEKEELSPKNYRITFSTKKTAQDLLSFAGLFCLFNVMKNDNEIYDLNDDAVTKFANIAKKFDAPYFIRYVFKSNLLRNKNRYDLLKGILEQDGLELEYGTTSQQRQIKLKEHFLQDLDVVDFGCGEGQNVSYFSQRQQKEKTYYAVDRSEEARKAVKNSAAKKGLTHVVVLEEKPKTENPYQVFLTEVIEHNSLQDSTKIIQEFLADPCCWQIVATTPNKDFNVNYNMADNETRHDDHVFEFTQEEFKSWVSMLENLKPQNWTIETGSLGDRVNGIQPTFFLKFKRNDVVFEKDFGEEIVARGPEEENLPPQKAEKKNKFVCEVEPQTLFLLVGPSMAGKTTFAKHAVEQLKSELRSANLADWHEPVIRHISSDEIRRSLYGVSDMHKYDERMLQASQAAFQSLSWQVEQAMKMPFNAEFVIVDSTGLDPIFRKEIKKIAEHNSYKVVLVLFDFKDSEDYFTGLDTVDSKTKSIVHKHVRRLREGYSSLQKGSYDDSITIKQKADIKKYTFDVKLDEYKKTFLRKKYDDGNFAHYQFFGDVQGCYKTLLKLLEQDGYKVDPDTKKITGHEGTILVFVGDLIDKGPDSIGVVRLLLANKDRVRAVKGNHENFVYKFFKGRLKNTPLPGKEIMDTYFTSIQEFKDDPEAIQDFIRFVEELCAPFLRSLDFVVTHAPCKLKHIGKLHGEGQKKQMNLRLIKKRKDFGTTAEYATFLEENLSFLQKDAENSTMPVHIFGHVMLKNPLKIKKTKLGIDTGAANKSGFLTSAVLLGGKKVAFSSVPMHEDEVAIDEAIPDIFVKKSMVESIKTEVDLDALDEVEERRLFRMAKNKINFVSGTMSPSSVDKEAKKLETIKTALTYYSRVGVPEVVLQPKYMGSRAQLYLYRDKPSDESDDKDMIVTRNGFSAPKYLKLETFYDQLRQRYEGLFQELEAKLLIFDGELMPWSALGEGLIEDIYQPIAVGIKTELKELTTLGLREAYEKVSATFANVDGSKNKKEVTEFFGFETPDFETRFQEQSEFLDRKAFAQKIGHSKVGTYYAFKEFSEIIPFEEQEEYVKTYERQLEVFGQLPDMTKENPFDYKAFALLKAISDDDSEKIFINAEELNDHWFGKINDDESIIVRLDVEEDWLKAEEFFDKQVGLELEGVVVKPRQTLAAPTVAPYLKVRAPNYLSLIYGWSYSRPDRLQELMDKKSIGRKLQLSIMEYELGRRLLQIPRKDISTENAQYMGLALQLIIEERAEKALDPRL